MTQLDFQRLLGDVAEHANKLLAVGQVVVYSNVDGQLSAEACCPKQPTRESPSEDARWCVKYLKPKVSNAANSTAAMPVATDVFNSLCVPFVASQNRILGVIEFRNKRTGGSFTDEDSRIALCFSRIATSALDRSRLFFRIEEWRRSVETLLSFNATVNQQLEPEAMVRELVANVTGFLEAQGGMAGVVIGTDKTRQVQCDGFYFAGLWSSFSRRWIVGEGIPGTVLETEFPYLSSDYRSDPLRERQISEAFDLGSCICVPIKNPKEDVLGFFQLHRRTGEPEFTWQDAAFLESLGNNAAVAIENARLVMSLDLKTEQIKRLSQDHVRRLEEERQHIARELHDETGQVLIGLKLRLQVLGGLLSEEQSDAKKELAELRGQLNQATIQLKDLAKRLRPPTLDELGFEASVRELVSDFRRRANHTVHLDFDSSPQVSKDAETALYRIVQECLTNVAKHANATRVDITFAVAGHQQVLRITDDGVGFDPNRSAKGFGHVGIRERVAMLDSQINVLSEIGQGTTIEILLKEGDPK